MSYRIEGQESEIYDSYLAARVEGAYIEIDCPIHGWGPTVPDGGCLACHREYWGLTEEEE